jgi:hypothetical protein
LIGSEGSTWPPTVTGADLHRKAPDLRAHPNPTSNPENYLGLSTPGTWFAGLSNEKRTICARQKVRLVYITYIIDAKMTALDPARFSAFPLLAET